VTGLHLVTLALQRRLSQPEVEHFLATFSGSQRYLFSFFVSEVLATQPEPLQRFLLQTSVLSRFCASLCDAVTAGQEVSECFRRGRGQFVSKFARWFGAVVSLPSALC